MKKIIILFFLLSSCEHYSSNVEIIYKNSSKPGYIIEEEKSFSKTLSNKASSPAYSHKREEIKPLSSYKTKTALPSSQEKPLVHSAAQASKPPASAGFISHIIKKGETYYSVARLYSIHPRALMDINDYKKNSILKPGDKIKIPSPPTTHINKEDSGYKSIQALKLPNNLNKTAGIAKKTNSLSKVLPCLIPFIFPIKQREQIEKYKETSSGEVRRDGLIIRISQEENIMAAADGKVVYVGDEFSDYGNLLIIRHANSYFSVYGHLKPIRLLDKMEVKKGEVIAKTSIREGKFYFSIREGKTPVDPAKCIPNI